MTVTARALRELHRIHRQLADLNEQLEHGPKQIRAHQVNVERLEQLLADSQVQHKETRKAADLKQLQLQSSESKIKDLNLKLNVCRSNREYQAFKEQIAADEMAASVLSDEILEAFDKIDQLELKVKQAGELFVKGKQELDKTQQAVSQNKGTLDAQIARLRADLIAAENALPDDFRIDYNRVVRARGQDAMAQVEREVCGGCNFQLTPNKISELVGSVAIFCNNCGRLIYLPEDRT